MHLVTQPERSRWTKEDVERAAGFEAEADRLIRKQSKTLERELNDSEKQEILTRLGWEWDQTGVKVTKGWNRTVTLAESSQLTLDEKGTARFAYDRIPVAERERIVNAMRRNGRDASNARVEEAYAALFLNDLLRYRRIVGTPGEP